jgi:hypothetical protein
MTDQEITEEWFYEISNPVKLDITETVKSGKPFTFPKIKVAPYKKALDEFVKYGQLIRFPEKTILKWKSLVLRNIAILDYVTLLCGHKHSNEWDGYELSDIWFGEENRNITYEQFWIILEELKLRELLPEFSNGHCLVSDYGLKPLLAIASELIPENDPNKIIVLINRALDISHQRSDLTELFIEGGSASLDFISYDTCYNKTIKYDRS